MQNLSPPRQAIKRLWQRLFNVLGFSHEKGKGGENGILYDSPQKPNQNDANLLGSKTLNGFCLLC